ncbi:MAG TPA: DUF2330 domain-containing protein [Polyangiaceae bacterium]|nr:DUF2330 domain-containing protein [Polyangiaceae bacterium]
MRARPVCVAAMLALAIAAPAAECGAFPGLVLGKEAGRRAVRSTSIVLVRHGGYSVVTLMAELEAPLRPFALLVPVPADVTPARLRTVRRSTIARVEALTAPRLHAFYEQDPCDDGPVEQAWDEHIKATGRGFLTPDGVPPTDRRYAVSNVISKPVAPVFKEKESEFTYAILDARTPERLASELTRRGYAADPGVLERLQPSFDAGERLLLAEVSLSHVELATGDRIRLGGIRYWSQKPLATLRESLASSGANEELFVYVFDRSSRYTVRDAPNVVVPTNVVVEPRAAEQLSGLYTGLLGAALERSPGAFALEYAWPTSGCGEPCPDVPLGVDELMTLGGDVLEERTTTAAERAPDPGPEPEREAQRFERELAEQMPKDRPAKLREHLADRREIARRSALSARQSYVLTRLHQARTDATPPRDLTLVPAPPVAGGVGIPEGRAGTLRTDTTAGAANKLQMRFVALYPWSRGVACSSPRRGAWGKRWASEARQSRAVPLALDLGTTRASRGVLESVLVRPLPELGLREHVTPVPSAATAPAAPSATSPPVPHRGCGVAPSGDAGGTGELFMLLAGVLRLACRRRGK